MSTFIVIYSGNAIAATQLFDSKNKCMLIKIRFDNYRSTKHCLLQFEPKGRAFDNESLNQWWIQRDMIHIMKQSLDYLQNPQNQRFPIHIAVLDSGIHPDHPEFNGFNGSYKDYDCVLEPGVAPGIDTNGHGTFVAGIICNLLKDVKHMIKLSIIKITGTDGVLHFECLKKAYDLLETNHEDVFLICQASGFPDKKNYSLKDKITGKKSLICAASNDGNWDPNTIAWPAMEAVAVGSHDKYAKTSGCSPQGQHLWVLAPGEYGFLEFRGEVKEVLGTSYAAPWVTALLAHFLLQLPLRYPGNVYDFMHLYQFHVVLLFH